MIPDALRPVVAITQARLSSTRLPRKVLLEVEGEPLLWWHLTRLRGARTIDRVVVATTEEPGAEAIVAIADRLGLDSIRGPLDDVLARFAAAAALAAARTIVRVTSDCPLIDPALVDRAVEAYAAARPACRYLSLDVSQYPRGLDCEVFDREGLDEAMALATAPAEREHVTPYLRRDRFAPRYLAPESAGAAHRWCVDTPEDLALIERVLGVLGAAPGFGWRDVAALVEANPDWRALNAAIVQKG